MKSGAVDFRPSFAVDGPGHAPPYPRGARSLMTSAGRRRDASRVPGGRAREGDSCPDRCGKPSSVSIRGSSSWESAIHHSRTRAPGPRNALRSGRSSKVWSRFRRRASADDGSAALSAAVIAGVRPIDASAYENSAASARFTRIAPAGCGQSTGLTSRKSARTRKRRL